MTPRISGITDLQPTDAPEGVTAWLGWAGELPVTIVVEEPATEDEIDAEFIAGVLADANEWIVRAGDAVEEFYQGEAGTPTGWSPEATFWAGQEWSIRFAECPLPEVGDLGVAVLFSGETLDSVEDLSAEDAEDLHEH